MTSVPPTPLKPRWGFSRNAFRAADAEDAIPIPPSVLPPTPPTPPPPSPSEEHSLTTPRDSARIVVGSAATNFRPKILSSTPYPANRIVNLRKPTPNRRNTQFPLLIPVELTLSIVRESPPTAAEELTCGDRVDGKEDPVSSTRPAEESTTAATERQCVAYGTPRETSVATAAAATTAGAAASVEGIPESTEHTMGACTSKKSSSSSEKKSEKSLQPSK